MHTRVPARFLFLVWLSACSPDAATDSLPSTNAGAPSLGASGTPAAGRAAAPAATGGTTAAAAPARAGAPAQAAAGTPAPATDRGRPSGGAPAPNGPNATAGRPAAPAAAGRPAAPSAGAGAAGSGSGSGADDFEAERQACVDTINMYRATLSLPALMRASPELEACSDMGAKKDGDANAAHSSAGDCRPLGAQNTCPGYPARNGDVTAALNQCLAQMWAEGEPPMGVDACIADRSGCFLEHGHWINMQSASSRQVACGFYKMANGRYWMNQNFGR